MEQGTGGEQSGHRDAVVKEHPAGGPDRDNDTPQRDSGEPVKKFRVVLSRIDPVAILALIVAVAAAIYQHQDSTESAAKLNQFGNRFEKTMKETVVGLVKVADGHIVFNGHQYNAPPGPIEIEFWTPSSRTKDYPGAKDWERVDSDTKLDLFADKLIRSHVIKGYRRVDVVGQGSRGPIQAGAWWISSNDSDFDMKAFLTAYYEFWNPGEDSVYMEVTPVASAYRPAPKD